MSLFLDEMSLAAARQANLSCLKIMTRPLMSPSITYFNSKYQYYMYSELCALGVMGCILKARKSKAGHILGYILGSEENSRIDS